MNRIKFAIFTLFVPFFCFGQINENNLKLLQAAYDGNDLNLILALKDSADINTKTKEGVTPLIYAAQKGHTDIVKILVHNGADINFKTNDSLNAFLAASIFNHTDIAEYLYQKGLSINSVNNKGVSALHFAAAYGYAEMTSFLLNSKATTNIVDLEGNTPLQTATYSGQTSIADTLLKYGADVNSRDNRGFTPIITASSQGYSDLIKLLIEHGANVNAVTNNGTSALSIATDKKNQTIILLLLNASAKVNFETTKEVNPFYISLKRADKQMLDLFKKNGIKSPQLFYFDWLNSSPGVNFNHKDLLFEFRSSVHEINYLFDAGLGFESRFSPKRILVETSPGVFDQYWESRKFISVFVKKEIRVAEKGSSLPLFFFQFSEAFTFGKYIATELKPDNKFIFIPAIGFLWEQADNSSFELRVEYRRFDHENVPPVRIGMAYNFSLDLWNRKLDANKSNEKKYINWLY